MTLFRMVLLVGCLALAVHYIWQVGRMLRGRRGLLWLAYPVGMLLAVLLALYAWVMVLQCPRQGATEGQAPQAAAAARRQGEVAPCPARRYTEADVDALARVVQGEMGQGAAAEQRLVAWTVLQRVDAGVGGSTVAGVASASGQFNYLASAPVDPAVRALCAAEAAAWAAGAQPPLLPPYAVAAPYYYFTGDGRHNWFRAEWR